MAAGVGSRFGGLKQLEPVGPSGEALLDYAVFDAVRAGIERVIFVLRPELERAFHESRGRLYASRAKIAYAVQSHADLPRGFAVPPGRTTPGGTGHAVLAARPAVRGPFVAINADDFYGPQAFVLLSEFLAGESEAPPERYAMVAYRLRNTLSECGSVARGVCETDGDGLLVGIREAVGIETGADGRIRQGAPSRGPTFSGDEPVSMNLWGFRPGLMAHLERRFRAFLGERGDDASAEFFLPTAVGGMVAEGLATVRVFVTDSPWFGLTHRGDLETVRRRLNDLVGRGAYPKKLWG